MSLLPANNGDWFSNSILDGAEVTATLPPLFDIFRRHCKGDRSRRWVFHRATM